MAVMKNISWLLKWTESWEDQHQGEVVPKSVYWPPNHIQHWLLKQHSAQQQSLNSKFWKFRGLKEDKSIYSQSSENPLNNRGVFDSSFSNLENWFLYGCLSTTFRGAWLLMAVIPPLPRETLQSQQDLGSDPDHVTLARHLSAWGPYPLGILDS